MGEKLRVAPESLDARLYGAAAYEHERAAIFAKSWLLLAHESRLVQPGACAALRVAGYPVFAVRGEDGAIRAFHNVCRHRAGPLAPDGESQCDGAIVCRYHGWRYALDGRLRSARDFGPVQGFDPRDYGLVPLACETWRGFVFVNMDAHARPLRETMAPLDARAHEVPFESFRFAERRIHDVRCNWKTYVENYLEGYHIPVVHPGLDAQIDSQRYVASVHPPVIFHDAPARGAAAVTGLWAWLWPCLGVNVYDGGVMMERMWPMGPRQTRLDYLWFFRDPKDREAVARAIAASEATTAEDLRICEAVQENLDAGIYRTGRLSPRHENGVAWFQAQIRDTLDDTAPA